MEEIANLQNFHSLLQDSVDLPTPRYVPNIHSGREEKNIIHGWFPCKEMAIFPACGTPFPFSTTSVKMHFKNTWFSGNGYFYGYLCFNKSPFRQLKSAKIWYKANFSFFAKQTQCGFFFENPFIICSADNRQPDWLMKYNYFCLISFSASLNMQKEIKQIYWCKQSHVTGSLIFIRRLN